MEPEKISEFLKDENRYLTRHTMLRLPDPDIELVRQGVFKCPLCGKVTEPMKSRLSTIDVKYNHDVVSTWAGSAITAKKTHLRVLICEECDFADKVETKIAFVIMSIGFIAWIVLNVYNLVVDISNDKYNFFDDILAIPFVYGLLLFIGCAVIKWLVCLIIHPNKRQVIKTSQAAKFNAIL